MAMPWPLRREACPGHCSHLLLIAVILLTVSNYCQSANGIGYPSGDTYPFGFVKNKESTDQGFVQIVACSNNRTNILVHFPLPLFPKYYVIGPWFCYEYTANCDLVSEQAISALISSEARGIQVYAVQADRLSTDGYLVPPVTQHSTEFVLAGWQSVNGLKAGVLISTAFNDTTIEIRDASGSPVHTISDAPAHKVYEYLVEDGDPTGWSITSTEGIGVTSVVSCGYVPDQHEPGDCDHMAEMIPPSGELGKVHPISPIVGRGPGAGYIVRVVATDDDTTVKWKTETTSFPEETLQKAKHKEITASDASEAMLVECSKPCVVMQINKGFEDGTISKTAPFMMLAVPVDRFVSETSFKTAYRARMPRDGPVLRAFFNDFVSIVTQKDERNSILFDGDPLGDSFFWQDIDDYSVATSNITRGYHSISVADGSSATFAAYVYGHLGLQTERGQTAYGFPVTYKMFGEGRPTYFPEEAKDGERSAACLHSVNGCVPVKSHTDPPSSTECSDSVTTGYESCAATAGDNCPSHMRETAKYLSKAVVSRYKAICNKIYCYLSIRTCLGSSLRDAFEEKNFDGFCKYHKVDGTVKCVADADCAASSRKSDFETILPNFCLSGQDGTCYIEAMTKCIDFGYFDPGVDYVSESCRKKKKVPTATLR